MRIALILAASLTLPASAQTLAAPGHAAAVATTLDPAAAAVVARFDADTAAARAQFNRQAGPAASIADALAARVAIDQAQRRALPDLSATDLTPSQRRAADTAIWARITAMDAANTAYVKRVLPADGWFRNRRDGRRVAHDAWLIVQHSPDPVFQRAVVARMAPLVASGDADGPDYARLYDRTEMFAGRPQRYGSQMTCKDGHYVATDLADPAGVDRRRADMRLSTMAEYREFFKAGC